MKNNSNHTTNNSSRLSINEAMKLAFQHHTAGRLDHAKMVLEQIVKSVPRHASALHLLGIIEHQVGCTQAAVQLIEKAVEYQPNVAQFHANLGEMCRTLKQLDKAVIHGNKSITLAPEVASSHSNLGIAYYDSGDLTRAEACQRQALALEPNHPTALNNMGSIRREQNDCDGAIDFYNQVLASHPEYVESMNNLGALLTETERPEEAVKILLNAVRVKPNYSDAHCNLATAFLALEDLGRASVGFNRALELKSNSVEALLGLAKVFQENKELSSAEDMVAKGLLVEPNNAEAHSLLGNICTEAGYPDKAEKAYARALELNQDLTTVYLGRGHLYMEKGSMDAAEADFRHAISLDSNNLGGRLSLAQVKKVKEGDENMVALIAEAEKLDSMLETKAMQLHFALGKCYDDTKQYDLAFKNYFEGCRLKRKRIHYSADDNDLLLANIKQIFNYEMLEKLNGGGCQSKLPIFILGMPRSGTTLTEQIIASHPLVYGAGELSDLMKVASGFAGEDSLGYPLAVDGVTQDELRSLGEQYVESVQTRAPESPYITDKMPANFNCVGLIHLMLPNAKIIHVKRNPVDTCLSCFTRMFNKSQLQSYDLSEIGRYYRNYAKMMAHWRDVLPEGAFYEVQYEELVADTENQARALIDYCGLEWDANCLDFYKNKRNVRTASITQVRQPIYNTSVERWRNYEKHLGELLNALGAFAPDV